VLAFGTTFLKGHQVALERVRDGHFDFTCFVEREICGQPFITALFSRVRPGVYTFSCRFSGHSITLSVKAGWITRVDWRDRIERTEDAASREVPLYLRHRAAAAEREAEQAGGVPDGTMTAGGDDAYGELQQRQAGAVG